MYQILANDPPLTLASKRQHHMHFKLTDILKWLGRDIKRRTRVVRSSPMRRAAFDWRKTA